MIKNKMPKKNWSVLLIGIMLVMSISLVRAPPAIDPIVTLVSPVDGTMNTDGIVRFKFIPVDDGSLVSCSLMYITDPSNSFISFKTISDMVNGSEYSIEVVGIEQNHVLCSDTLQWRVDCKDNVGLTGSSSVFNLDTREDARGTSTKDKMLKTQTSPIVDDTTNVAPTQNDLTASANMKLTVVQKLNKWITAKFKGAISFVSNIFK